jgi:hypothetical protein
MQYQINSGAEETTHHPVYRYVPHDMHAYPDARPIDTLPAIQGGRPSLAEFQIAVY